MVQSLNIFNENKICGGIFAISVRIMESILLIIVTFIQHRTLLAIRMLISGQAALVFPVSPAILICCRLFDLLLSLIWVQKI